MVLYSIFVTIDAAMVAWFFDKLKELNFIILTSFAIGVLLATFLAFIMNIKVKKMIKLLGEKNA